MATVLAPRSMRTQLRVSRRQPRSVRSSGGRRSGAAARASRHQVSGKARRSVRHRIQEIGNRFKLAGIASWTCRNSPTARGTSDPRRRQECLSVRAHAGRRLGHYRGWNPWGFRCSGSFAAGRCRQHPGAIGPVAQPLDCTGRPSRHDLDALAGQPPSRWAPLQSSSLLAPPGERGRGPAGRQVPPSDLRRVPSAFSRSHRRPPTRSPPCARPGQVDSRGEWAPHRIRQRSSTSRTKGASSLGLQCPSDADLGSSVPAGRCSDSTPVRHRGEPRSGPHRWWYLSGATGVADSPDHEATGAPLAATPPAHR